MTSSELLARVDGLRAGRIPFVLATVVRAERPTSARPGDRALVLPDGTMEGFVGGSCAQSTVLDQGLKLLGAGETGEAGESMLLRITPAAGESPAPAAGVVTVGNPCHSGGSLEIFMESVLPPTLVHVTGDSPVSRALVRVGEALDYEVRAFLDALAPVEPDTGVVVVASHGEDEHRTLMNALQTGAPYIGLIASPRRGSEVLAGLDVPETERARVHTPAGLDIGARSATEVAVSVYADVIAQRHQHGRAHGQEHGREHATDVTG
jgi:xanthine dehydrogenase accessory factor